MTKRYKPIISIAAALGAVAFYAALLVILVNVESKAPDKQIKDFGDAFWFAYVTLTTIGYGDVLPVTVWGKVIAGWFVLTSIVFLGYFVGNITNIINRYRDKKKMGHLGTNFKDHVIIVEWDEFSSMIAKELYFAGRKVAVVSGIRDHIDKIYEMYDKERFFVLFTDPKNYDSYDKCSIRDSMMVFVNLDSDSDKLVFILNMKKKYPEANFIISLNDGNLKDTFKSAGVTYVLSKNEIASRLIASFIFEPHVADYTTDLIDSAKSEGDYDIQEFRISKDNPYLNKTWGEFFINVKSDFGLVAIGIVKSNNNELRKLPADNELIEQNDYIILIGDGGKFDHFVSHIKTKQGL